VILVELVELAAVLQGMIQGGIRQVGLRLAMPAQQGLDQPGQELHLRQAPTSRKDALDLVENREKDRVLHD
jgi:hypothetical protein